MRIRMVVGIDNQSVGITYEMSECRPIEQRITHPRLSVMYS